ncbi:MAG: DUF1616 domain-containing protein [Roseiflexaceae bacterium]|nr:DUF1616 domain-containing protein [Roseiflexaceae bacterium]
MTRTHKKVGDLLLVVALTLAAMLVALSSSTYAAIYPAIYALIGLILGLPLALILPGYVLMAAGSPSGAIGALERLLFSLGASIALSIIGGFLLNLTPWGLRPGSWALLLGSVTLLACGIAFLRRQTLAPSSIGPRIRLRLVDLVLFGCAALITGGALVVATTSAASPPADGFTQLWMLPVDDGVQIGIHNLEAQPMQYRLELAVAGQVVRHWQRVDLQNDGRWAEHESLKLGAGVNVEARLYRADDPAHVYRLVTLR